MNPGLQVWHPFTQEALDPPPIRITKAEGVYLYTDDGRRLIDGISSWWVNLHGHGHPDIVSAIAAQAARVDHVLLAGFTHDSVEQLRECLRKILSANLSHVFFSDDGSTAVEVALKLAVQYWQNVGRPQKKAIVALDHAYHGDTVGAMSVGATSVFTDPFRDLLFPVHRVHSAYCHRCPVGKTRSTCSIDCVDKLQRLLEQEHGVLLIADEVLTGFGRCGKMFACELASVVPDLMCLSKGLTGGVLPMGATICTPEIHGAFVGTDRARTFYHGHSYTGNPIAAAAAVASCRIFEREPVFERINRIAEIHRARLAAIKDHPAVGDVRSIGTMAAIELRADDPGYASKMRSRLYKFFIDVGVLLRPLGNVVYILPPYAISSAELNFIHDRIFESLALC